MTTTLSTSKNRVTPKPQVFINFRGEELRKSFISHLVGAFKRNNIKIYIDEEERRGLPIDVLFTRIDESKIALTILSKKYGDSDWCLNELGKIMKNAEEKRIEVIPIFFNVTPNDVRNQLGEFGNNLLQGDRYDFPAMTQWRKDLRSVAKYMGLTLTTARNELEFVENIIAKVNEVIADILLESGQRGGGGGECSTMLSSGISSCDSSSVTSEHLRGSPGYHGMEQRLKQLAERWDIDSAVTQILGIVGMCGIGKTTLATQYFEKFCTKFVYYKNILSVHKRSEKGSAWLIKELLDGKSDDKAKIFRTRSFIVLDDVTEEKQIEFLLHNRNRIKKGSKIVITTRDKSWIQRLVHDTYVVPELNDNEALQLFSYHAFNTPTENFMSLSNKFVDYAGGNPRALEEMGKELCGKDEDHWKARLETVSYRCNEDIKRDLIVSYEKLTDKQKDAFLDIACFFRSEDEYYVTALLASKNSGEAVKEVRDLANKFMISVSAGKIQMTDLLCSFGKELGLLASVDNLEKSRLWSHNEVIGALLKKQRTESEPNVKKKQVTECVRGIVLDLSKLTKGIAMKRNKLTKMPNLRYLKIFDSRCPRQCKDDFMVHLPEKLDLPLQEIRYLHWLKFPLKRLPSDFKTDNLIDLRLPYSKIERIWKVSKETPNLKWVDLSHSTELIDLSALSKAESLQRLNLEGCIKLVNFPEDTENMKSLAFLNLRGCASLLSLPEMKSVTTLKTLILSDCSKLKKFQVISKNLERLYLDGTAIESLPSTIQLLERLIVLNLKNCKMLESLPDCLDKLKALEELILSGCSELASFPEIKEKMENLQTLLLDGTLIKEVPTLLLRCANSMDQVNIQQPPRMSGLSLLRRLCLSKNDMISGLQCSISDLHHLKWIDLKYCKNLVSIPMLPPNLQCLDAHECISLRTVASPLALLTATEQVPSSFIFTNCEKLEHTAKNAITCYGHNKGRLLSETLNRHNKALSFEALVATCFPGSEVPAWFNHKASGPVLEPELPRHWSESGFVGIALCAIVLFGEQKIQNKHLQVKCDFKNVNTFSSYFNCPIGGLPETSCHEQRKIKSAHVFIGYTNWLNIKNCQEEDGEEVCVLPTKASIEFQVTDDFGKVTNCEVLKCGFSLVYESGSWEASTRKDDIEQGEVESLVKNKKVSKITSADSGTTTMRDARVNGVIYSIVES